MGPGHTRQDRHKHKDHEGVDMKRWMGALRINFLRDRWLAFGLPS